MAGSRASPCSNRPRLEGERWFQAVYVIATGVQTSFFDQLAAHPQGLRPRVGPAHRLSCPLCGDLVWQRLSLSAPGRGQWTVRPGPTRTVSGWPRASDSQAVLFLNAVREGRTASGAAG
jgi:hypothetical protein